MAIFFLEGSFAEGEGSKGRLHDNLVSQISEFLP